MYTDIYTSTDKYISRHCLSTYQ